MAGPTIEQCPVRPQRLLARESLARARRTVPLPSLSQAAAPTYLLEKNIDIGFEARVVWFCRIGKIFLDEAVLRFEAFFIEKSGDEIVGRINIVVGAAMQELHRLAGRGLA